MQLEKRASITCAKAAAKQPYMLTVPTVPNDYFAISMTASELWFMPGMRRPCAPHDESALTAVLLTFIMLCRHHQAASWVQPRHMDAGGHRWRDGHPHPSQQQRGLAGTLPWQPAGP